MTDLFTTGCLLSFDSLIAAAALGPLISEAKVWRVAALFGLFDSMALVIGTTFNYRWCQTELAALIILTFGAYCLVAACWNKFRANPSLGATVLPIAMSLDNLVYGAEIHGSNGIVLPALMLGATSWACAWGGLIFGRLIRFDDVRMRESLTGFVCVIAAFVFVCAS